MLKKISMALVAIGLGLGPAGMARAADGSITFKATISASTCTISSVASVGSLAADINLGSVSNTSLKTAAQTTLPFPFDIVLRDCAVATPPTITFTGAPVTTAGFVNAFSTAVDHVGIRIRDRDAPDTIYTPNVPTVNTGLSALTGLSITDATARFEAYLVAHKAPTGDGVGSVDTTVTFSINYI
ncbi:MAG: fimbrial protein [Aeromonas popoffii]|uniref:fimbrial protein n=1 Tax=Aeromonas popoffii TaxID=70856 RepID=UPI003F2B0E73